MKVVKFMVRITKDESRYLRENGVKEITRTMSQKSSRHIYYAAEDKFILDLLNEYRNSENVVFSYGNTKS